MVFEFKVAEPDDEVVTLPCPGCGYPSYKGWWCADCINAQVAQARAELDPCNCNEVQGPHRHEVEH